MSEVRVYTIGHSTRPIQEFVGLLEANAIDRLVDVRTVAGSRHNPQFGEGELSRSMAAVNIDYQRLTKLGGLRYTPAGHTSINGAWRNKSFRDYADYMQTAEFTAGLDELIHLTGKQIVAIMCAEAVPWRCHRSLIGDALLARGLAVWDIISLTSTKPHAVTRFAKIDGERVWYPPEDRSTDAENRVPGRLSVGDHVRWNSGTGQAHGTVVKIHQKDVDYQGHTRRCSPTDPQYETKNDNTGHMAMHRSDALIKI